MAARYLLLLVVQSTAANKWSQIYRSGFFPKALAKLLLEIQPGCFFSLVH